MQQQSEVRFFFSRPITYEEAWVDANGKPLSEKTATSKSKYLIANDKDGDLRCRLGIAPNLEVCLLTEEGNTLIFNRTRKIVLKGDLWLDLLPLLAKGELNGDQLTQQLANKYTALAVRTSLYQLFAKEIIIVSEHNLTPTQALSWITAGLTPCAAEQRLATLPLHTTTLSTQPFPPPLLAKLQQLGGWQHVDRPEDAALIIYLVDDYQQDEIAAINAAHLADGKKWLLLQYREDVALCGPLFCSAPHPVITNRPCWECLRVAMAESDNSIDAYLQQHKHQRLPRPAAQTMARIEALAMHLHTELVSLLLDAEVVAPLRGHLLLFSLPQMSKEYHWVMQRPQCHACGYGKLDASRPLPPLCLQTQKALDFTSGGIRTRSAEHVFEQWRKYVSPVTGATGDLSYTKGRYYDANGSVWDWFHNTTGSKNRALQNKQLDNLLKGFRGISGGKGSTAVQSYVSSICESFERNAGVFREDEERYHEACWRDFKDGEVIAPNVITLFSETQYRNREVINAQGNPFSYVPHPFDCDEMVRWTPVWSLTESRAKYLLSSSLYYTGVSSPTHFTKYRYACSNGTSGGATLEEAILQGCYELIERDACAIWWYNRLVLPPVELEAFDDLWLRRAKTFYAALQRDLWVLDMTSDLGVPACVALSRNICPEQPDKIIFGFGAHLSQRVAVCRAISEMNQALMGLDLRRPDGINLDTWLQSHSCPETANWITKVSTDDPSFRWLLPKPSALPHSCSSLQFSDTLEEINYLRAIIESKGMEMLVLDQSRPEIDYCVVRVIVPGLRHFWCRLAPGRLYDVPVARGQLSQAHKEEEMNPIAMFL